MKKIVYFLFLFVFNTAFAQDTLIFKTGEILEVRDATEEELKHGHAHGPDDAHHQ